MEFIKNLKLPIIVGIVCFIAGRFIFQPKTKVIEKEKIVYVEKKEEKKNVKKVTKTREEKRPDGTIITDTTTSEEDRSSTKTEVVAKKEKSKESKKGSGVIIGAMLMDDIDDLRSKDHYGVMMAVPLSGRSYVFSTVDMQKRIGIGLALEF